MTAAETAIESSPVVPTTRLPVVRRWWRRLAMGAATCLLLITALIAWRIITWPRPTAAVTWAGEVEGTECQLISEVFLPPATAGQPPRWPAVVLLHGIDGPSRYRWSYYVTANELRNQGYAVFIVHYFGAVEYEDLWHFKPDRSLDDEAIERFRLRDQSKWVGAVTCAIRQISQRDDIDPSRIAIDGYSLGGFISLSAAREALRDPATPDVCCVVENWGAMFRGEQFSAGFPPTLLIHGANDPIVEPRHAQTTFDALRKVGVDAQLYFVRGGKHWASDATSKQMTREFLEKHLKN